VILVGDCREMLATLPERSVQTVITSPPYFGLRDYGTGEWDGGDPTCEHTAKRQPREERGRGGLTGGVATVGAQDGGSLARSACPCGARRVDRQIGLEPTPDEFVAALVDVFREVRRVLRDDGTVWLNLGDSYAGSWGNQGRKSERGSQRPINGEMLTPASTSAGATRRRCPVGMKPKDLIGIPWMVAFALRADGWYLRSDIIWAKLNPMPESVTDRPTKAHEYLFLLSKGPRYFWDADAIRERFTDDIHGAEVPRPAVLAVTDRNPDAAGRNKRSVWTVATQPFSAKSLGIFRQVRVAPDDADDDTKGTTSPDCPVHGDRPAPAATAPDDGRAGDTSTGIAGSDGRPGPTQPDELAPTGPPLAPSPADGSSDSPRLERSPAATPHSSGSHRTDLGPATSRPCTPSAGTPVRTGDTSASPGPAGPDANTPASSSAPAGSGGRPSAQTAVGTARSSSCTCELYRLEEVDHFATFPPKLIEPCVFAGSPPKCCGVCGAPWRRVVERGTGNGPTETGQLAPQSSGVALGTLR
jgi:DNA modification methylase